MLNFFVKIKLSNFFVEELLDFFKRNSRFPMCGKIVKKFCRKIQTIFCRTFLEKFFYKKKKREIT